MKENLRIRKRRNNVIYYNGNFDELFVTGIYDEGNFNNRGKFGKGEKLYWNKISGKWVRKKGECYLSKSIWVYEFENLNEKKIVKLFKKGEVFGFKYIDRVSYFIKFMYLKYKLNGKLKESEILNDNKKGWIYISQRNIISLLGSDWGYILSRLKGLKIVDYKKVGVSKYNRRDIINIKLNIKYLGEIIGRRYIENKILEKNILKGYNKDGFDLREIEFIRNCELNIDEEKLNEICEEKYKNKYSQCLKELSWGKMFFNENDIKRRKDFIESDNKEEYFKRIKNRYKVYKDLFDEMNKGYIDYELFKIDDHGGRFYNIVNGIDKEFRRELKYKGEKLVEIDFSGMYVKCLVFMFERLKLIRSKGFKRRRKDKFLELKRNGYFDIDEKFKKENKIKYGFEWDDGEIKDYLYGGYKGIKENSDLWNKRKYYFEKKYGEVKYDLGVNSGYGLNKKINEISEEEEWVEFFEEYNNVIKEFNAKEDEDYYLKNFGINSNVLNFRRIDNILNNIINYFEGKLKKDFFVENKLKEYIVGEEIKELKEYKNYEEYLKDGNKEFKIKGEFSWEGDKIVDENYFKIKFNRGDILKYKILDYKFSKKISGDKMFKDRYYEMFEKDAEWVWVNGRGNYINVDNFDEWLLEKYGKVKKLKLSEDIEIDYSEDEKIGFEGFVELYKNNVLSSKKLDFYNYLKWKLNYNNIVRNYGKSGFGDLDIFDRDFYKILIMRILFTQNYILNNLKMNDIDKGRRNLIEEIFGVEGKMYLEKIKGFKFKRDEYGEKVEINNNYSEMYKNISKILSIIEVDIMKYLKRRVFWENGLVKNEFYINVFDGFMVRESQRNLLKCELNMVLENEVGYMFYMK